MILELKSLKKREIVEGEYVYSFKRIFKMIDSQKIVQFAFFCLFGHIFSFCFVPMLRVSRYEIIFLFLNLTNIENDILNCRRRWEFCQGFF